MFYLSIVLEMVIGYSYFSLGKYKSEKNIWAFEEGHGSLEAGQAYLIEEKGHPFADYYRLQQFYCTEQLNSEKKRNICYFTLCILLLSLVADTLQI